MSVVDLGKIGVWTSYRPFGLEHAGEAAKLLEQLGYGAWWESMNGKQEGDPAKLAAALVQIVDQDNPPVRWVAGTDAVAAVEQKARDLLAQVDAYRDISTSLAIA